MKTYNNESDLVTDIRLEVGASKFTRLFRNNVGVLQDARGQHVTYGLCPGSSDLIGWRSRLITPDMVDTYIAQFVAIECKFGRSVLSGKQRQFIEVVKAQGGLAGEARSVEDAYRILDGHDDR